jgi:hypothetical protein
LVLTLITLLTAGSTSLADPITGVQGYEYKVYKHSTPPKNLADLKVGASSSLSCDALGFITDYNAVWDNVRNIADQVVSNKRVLLLGAAQYLLAKAEPTLYSVLEKLNSLAELALKYNFDACALYKKAQQAANKDSSAEGLTGLCMSILGDPSVCTAPGKALEAVFGKSQVDVVDEIVKNPEVADLIKAVAGTVVLTANGDGLETDIYAPSWKIADIYSAFYAAYYNKYAEIAEKVHDGLLNADDYEKEYAGWITVGGQIDLSKVKVVNGWIDLTEAKQGGYQIPYAFFYDVAHFSPAVAAVYIRKLAMYAALIDTQAFLAAVERALTAGAAQTGKAEILQKQALIESVEKGYRQFAQSFGTAGRQDLLALMQSAENRYKSYVGRIMSAETENTLTNEYLKGLLEGPDLSQVKVVQPK